MAAATGTVIGGSDDRSRRSGGSPGVEGSTTWSKKDGLQRWATRLG